MRLLDVEKRSSDFDFMSISDLNTDYKDEDSSNIIEKSIFRLLIYNVWLLNRNKE